MYKRGTPSSTRRKSARKKRLKKKRRDGKKSLKNVGDGKAQESQKPNLPAPKKNKGKTKKGQARKLQGNSKLTGSLPPRGGKRQRRKTNRELDLPLRDQNCVFPWCRRIRTSGRKESDQGMGRKNQNESRDNESTGDKKKSNQITKRKSPSKAKKKTWRASQERGKGVKQQWGPVHCPKRRKKTRKKNREGPGKQLQNTRGKMVPPSKSQRKLQKASEGGDRTKFRST